MIFPQDSWAGHYADFATFWGCSLHCDRWGFWTCCAHRTFYQDYPSFPGYSSSMDYLFDLDYSFCQDYSFFCQDYSFC